MNVAANAPSVAIRTATRLELSFESWDWPFARERRAEIDAHFIAKQAAKSQLWNGRVMLARDPRHDGDTYRARYFETDFASFLAWRDWGLPDKTVFNSFGMGALRGSDGVFILGEMGLHTANTGRIYFPAGTPDLNDRRGDVVDIAGSVAREVEEEVGLRPGDYRIVEGWHCVHSGQSVALMQLLEADVPAEELRRRILRALAAQSEPELSAIHLVRDRRDFTSAMPVFVTAYIDAMTAA